MGPAGSITVYVHTVPIVCTKNDFMTLCVAIVYGEPVFSHLLAHIIPHYYIIILPNITCPLYITCDNRHF